MSLSKTATKEWCNMEQSLSYTCDMVYCSWCQHIWAQRREEKILWGALSECLQALTAFKQP